MSQAIWSETYLILFIGEIMLCFSRQNKLNVNHSWIIIQKNPFLQTFISHSVLEQI